MNVTKDETIDVLSFRPKFKAVEKVDDLTVDAETVGMAKADGEFDYLEYNRNGETFCVNRWGRKLTNIPCINDFQNAMDKSSIKRVVCLVELYAMDNGKPLMLPKFIHYLKGGDSKLREKIYIGIWDVVSINDLKLNEAFAWKLEEAERLVKNCRWVHVLPWKQVKSLAELKGLWRDLVEGMGYEGLVVRNACGVWKVKPVLEMDAVIIGLNKRKLMEQKLVTSLMLGLLKKDMTFVEVGDVASGINMKLRTALWKLMEYKVGEDKETVFVKPIVVCTIQFNDMYPETTNRVFYFGACDKAERLAGNKSFEERGKQTLIKLKSPRLTGFREDKIVCLNDVGLNQIPANVRGNGGK